jgi:hypothetical protein
MTVLTLLSILFGAVLGQHFRVLVLVPATAVGWMIAILVEVLADGSFWSILQALTIVAIALQMGFFGGMLLRSVIAGARAAGTRRHSNARHSAAR